MYRYKANGADQTTLIPVLTEPAVLAGEGEDTNENTV